MTLHTGTAPYKRLVFLLESQVTFTSCNVANILEVIE